MQTRSSDENSVCSSVKRVICDKTKEWCVRICTLYERPLSVVFREEEWLVEATPSAWNFGSTGPRWSKIADFEPIFARSASAVTPSEKVELTLRGSPIRAFQWWSSYVVSKPPKERWKTQSVQNLTISWDNSETVWDRMSVQITNRKSHTGFRFVPTSMTLNDLERHNSPYFAFYH